MRSQSTAGPEIPDNFDTRWGEMDPPAQPIPGEIGRPVKWEEYAPAGGSRPNPIWNYGGRRTEMTPQQQSMVQALQGPQNTMLAQPPPPPMQLAGDVIQMPQYPGLEMDRRIGMSQLKDRAFQQNPGVDPERMNGVLDRYFGGGAKIMDYPGGMQKWLERNGMRPR